MSVHEPNVLAILAVLIVAAIGVYAISARDLTRARSRLAGRSKTIETSFGTLEYAIMGVGEPMLIVHGAAGGFDQGIDMTSAIAGRGYRLIAPSRFGYLRSTMPGNLTTAMQAEAYAELLDRLGIDKANVVGISAGAWSSIQFAIRYPERCRALVLLAPADYLPAGTSIQGGAVARAIFNSDFVAWAAMMFAPGNRARSDAVSPPDAGHLWILRSRWRWVSWDGLFGWLTPFGT